MRITALSRTIFLPFGPTAAGAPAAPSYSFVDPFAGTLIFPPGGPQSAAAVAPELGTLLMAAAGVAPDAGTLLAPLTGPVDPDAGTLIIA